jgi:tyrosinase
VALWPSGKQTSEPLAGTPALNREYTPVTLLDGIASDMYILTKQTRGRYWDWTLDATDEEAWAASPIFDSAYGFGGNGPYVEDVSNLTQTSAVDDLPGRTGGGCVASGPFANLTVPMGPGNSTAATPHCLRRDFTPWLATQTLNRTLADWQLEADEFAVYDRRVQAMDLTLSGITTHGGGHFGVGGMVGEVRIALCRQELWVVH